MSSEATGAAALWGSADYNRLAELFAPIHDELVERLAPAVGIEWLDVATGTGAINPEIEEKTWILEGADGEELYQLWFRPASPYKATIESFDDVRREEFKREYIEYCEQYRQGDRVAVPRPYLLVLGKRR